MEVFYTLDAAKEHLKIVVEDFKKDVTNWDDTDMYTIEETEESFTWYESGYYDNNHYCVDIYTKTIHDGTIKVGGK
jgi:two-component SAPR family response regulator